MCQQLSKWTLKVKALPSHRSWHSSPCWGNWGHPANPCAHGKCHRLPLGSLPHLRSHSPPQNPLLMHQHRCVLLAQVPGDTGKQQRQEQHEQQAQAPASEQVHAREEQEMYTSLEPRKYKGFKNNTPGSRHSNNGWHRFFKTTKQSTRPAGILAAVRGCTLQYRRTYMPQIPNHKGFWNWWLYSMAWTGYHPRCLCLQYSNHNEKGSRKKSRRFGERCNIYNTGINHTSQKSIIVSTCLLKIKVISSN